MSLKRSETELLSQRVQDSKKDIERLKSELAQLVQRGLNSKGNLDNKTATNFPQNLGEDVKLKEKPKSPKRVIAEKNKSPVRSKTEFKSPTKHLLKSENKNNVNILTEVKSKSNIENVLNKPQIGSKNENILSGIKLVSNRVPSKSLGKSQNIKDNLVDLTNTLEGGEEKVEKKRSYDVDEAREYMRKQKEKRLEQLRLKKSETRNLESERKQKLLELQQKSLKIVHRNRERSKSREKRLDAQNKQFSSKLDAQTKLSPRFEASTKLQFSPKSDTQTSSKSETITSYNFPPPRRLPIPEKHIKDQITIRSSHQDPSIREERTKAATMIQSYYKGYRQRKIFQESLSIRRELESQAQKLVEQEMESNKIDENLAEIVAGFKKYISTERLNIEQPTEIKKKKKLPDWLETGPQSPTYNFISTVKKKLNIATNPHKITSDIGIQSEERSPNQTAQEIKETIKKSLTEQDNYKQRRNEDKNRERDEEDRRERRDSEDRNRRRDEEERHRADKQRKIDEEYRFIRVDDNRREEEEGRYKKKEEDGEEFRRRGHRIDKGRVEQIDGHRKLEGKVQRTVHEVDGHRGRDGKNKQRRGEEYRYIRVDYNGREEQEDGFEKRKEEDDTKFRRRGHRMEEGRANEMDSHGIKEGREHKTGHKNGRSEEIKQRDDGVSRRKDKDETRRNEDIFSFEVHSGRSGRRRNEANYGRRNFDEQIIEHGRFENEDRRIQGKYENCRNEEESIGYQERKSRNRSRKEENYSNSEEDMSKTEGRSVDSFGRNSDTLGGTESGRGENLLSGMNDKSSRSFEDILRESNEVILDIDEGLRRRNLEESAKSFEEKRSTLSEDSRNRSSDEKMKSITVRRSLEDSVNSFLEEKSFEGDSSKKSLKSVKTSLEGSSATSYKELLFEKPLRSEEKGLRVGGKSVENSIKTGARLNKSDSKSVKSKSDSKKIRGESKIHLNLDLKQIESLKLKSKLSDLTDSDTSKNVPDISSEDIKTMSNPTYSQPKDQKEQVFKKPLEVHKKAKSKQVEEEYKLEIDLKKIQNLRLRRRDVIENTMDFVRKEEDRSKENNISSITKKVGDSKKKVAEETFISKVSNPKTFPSEIDLSRRGSIISYNKCDYSQKSSSENENSLDAKELYSFRKYMKSLDVSGKIQYDFPKRSVGANHLVAPVVSLKNDSDYENLQKKRESKAGKLENVGKPVEIVLKDGQKNYGENSGTSNQIHVRVEAELHLLNDFHESMRQFMAVEKSLLDLQNKSNTMIFRETRDTQTSIVSKTTDSPSRSENSGLENFQPNDLNLSRNDTPIDTETDLQSPQNNPESSQNNNLDSTKDNLNSTKDNLDSTKDNLDSTKDDLDSNKDNLDSTKDNLDTTKDNLDSTKDNLDSSISTEKNLNLVPQSNRKSSIQDFVASAKQIAKLERKNKSASTLNLDNSFLSVLELSELNETLDETKEETGDMDNTQAIVERNSGNLQAGISLGMFEQLIRDEDARIKNLKTILKIREKALLDRTKGELAWLEIQKKHLLETGKPDEASAVKKKQRGIIIKLQHEKHEMQKLKQMQKAASKERKTILKEQRNMIKAQLSTFAGNLTKIRRTPSKDRRKSGPVKVYQTTETSLSRKSSVGEEIIYASRSESVISRITETGSVESGKSLIRETVCCNRTENAKRSLLMREAALQKRRREAEKLLQWHQKLLEEEKKITELEMAASNIINQVPSVTIENSKTKDKYTFKGSQLNVLWENMTGLTDKKFEDGETYNLSQVALERFCKDARRIANKDKVKIPQDEEQPDLEQGIKQSESTLNEIIQNISNITDEISELYKLSSVKKLKKQEELVRKVPDNSIHKDSIKETERAKKKISKKLFQDKDNSEVDTSSLVDEISSDNEIGRSEELKTEVQTNSERNMSKSKMESIEEDGSIRVESKSSEDLKSEVETIKSSIGEDKLEIATESDVLAGSEIVEDVSVGDKSTLDESELLKESEIVEDVSVGDKSTLDESELLKESEIVEDVSVGDKSTLDESELLKESEIVEDVSVGDKSTLDESELLKESAIVEDILIENNSEQVSSQIELLKKIQTIKDISLSEKSEQVPSSELLKNIKTIKDISFSETSLQHPTSELLKKTQTNEDVSIGDISELSELLKKTETFEDNLPIGDKSEDHSVVESVKISKESKSDLLQLSSKKSQSLEDQIVDGASIKTILSHSLNEVSDLAKQSEDEVQILLDSTNDLDKSQGLDDEFQLQVSSDKSDRFVDNLDKTYIKVKEVSEGIEEDFVKCDGSEESLEVFEKDGISFEDQRISHYELDSDKAVIEENLIEDKATVGEQYKSGVEINLVEDKSVIEERISDDKLEIEENLVEDKSVFEDQLVVDELENRVEDKSDIEEELVGVKSNEDSADFVLKSPELTKNLSTEASSEVFEKSKTSETSNKTNEEKSKLPTEEIFKSISITSEVQTKSKTSADRTKSVGVSKLSEDARSIKISKNEDSYQNETELAMIALGLDRREMELVHSEDVLDKMVQSKSADIISVKSTSDYLKSKEEVENISEEIKSISEKQNEDFVQSKDKLSSKLLDKYDFVSNLHLKSNNMSINLDLPSEDNLKIPSSRLESTSLDVSENLEDSEKEENLMKSQIIEDLKLDEEISSENSSDDLKLKLEFKHGETELVVDFESKTKQVEDISSIIEHSEDQTLREDRCLSEDDSSKITDHLGERSIESYFAINKEEIEANVSDEDEVNKGLNKGEEIDEMNEVSEGLETEESLNFNIPVIDVAIKNNKIQTSSSINEESLSIKSLDESINKSLNETGSRSLNDSGDDSIGSNKSPNDSDAKINFDVKKRVAEILADDNLASSLGAKSPRMQELYVTTSGLISPETSPESGSPVEKDSKVLKDIGSEAEELLRKQLAIDQEIKELKQQQQQANKAYYIHLREIPNKPPPPYKPPVQTQTPIGIIPTSFNQVQPLIETLAKMFYKAHKDNNLYTIKFPEVISISNINKPCQEFIFDLSKEKAIEHYKQFEELSKVSWMKLEKHSFKKQLNAEGLKEYLGKKLKEILFGDCLEPKQNMIMKWSQKKCDNVDRLLILESAAEEADWINYDKDELVVKNEVTNDIMNMLLQETAEFFASMASRKVKNVC